MLMGLSGDLGAIRRNPVHQRELRRKRITGGKAQDTITEGGNKGKARKGE